MKHEKIITSENFLIDWKQKNNTYEKWEKISKKDYKKMLEDFGFIVLWNK